MKFTFRSLLVFLVLWITWNTLNDLLISLIDDPIAEYQINMDTTADADIMSAISDQLLDEFRSQIVIASPQRISISSLLQSKLNFSEATVSWIPSVNLDFLNYVFRWLRGRVPYGGFILYDYNIGNYSAENYKKYVSDLRRIYSIKVIVNFKNQDIPAVSLTIEPWIVSDCDILLTENPYCRNFSIKRLTKSVPISDVYREIGLNSPLSPSIDRIIFDESCSPGNPVVQAIVLKMFQNKQLPVLKHFLYDGRSDTHISNYRDSRSLDAIRSASKCYSAINELGIPFAIMPSHFYLEAIDPDNILTKSVKFQSYIRKNLPNAVTISDEVSMLGYSTTDDFSTRVASSASDMLLIHGGSLRFWKRLQIQNGINQIPDEVAKEKIVRILMLKEAYGLIKTVRNQNFRTGEF